MATIISAFPACGKTTYYKEWGQDSRENVWRIENNGEQVYNNLGNPCGSRILDSDSSEFSWIKDKNGINTKDRNPNFPNNYIQHIKENSDKVDIIFVSSHEIVRKALKENNIAYFIVYPNKDMLDEWVRRMTNRGDNQAFIDFITKNWNNFLDDIENEIYPTKVKLSHYVNMDAITETLMGTIIEHREIVEN